MNDFDVSAGVQAAVGLADLLSQAHHLVLVQQPAMHLALQHNKAGMPLELQHSKGAMLLGGLQGGLEAVLVVGEGHLAPPSSRHLKAAVLGPCGLCANRSLSSELLQ